MIVALPGLFSYLFFLVEIVPLDIYRFKSKKGASVSEEFALFSNSADDKFINFFLIFSHKTGPQTQ